jgi:hypothetical protein
MAILLNLCACPVECEAYSSGGIQKTNFEFLIFNCELDEKSNI